MKTIESIIRLEKVGDVRQALAKKGITSMTFNQVMGRGEQKEARIDLAVGTEVVFDLFARVHMMIIVEDNKVDELVKAITEAAKTGAKGDGIIFVRPVERIVKIRTGEEIG